MNLNKGCIEILRFVPNVNTFGMMNLNKGCIEIDDGSGSGSGAGAMNLNKGCIEMYHLDHVRLCGNSSDV